MTVIATCHCGGTRIELDAAPTPATACTCTYCSKVGALWSYHPLAEVRVVSEAYPGIYSKSGFNEHHFCARCGITTHAITPDYTEADIGKDTMPTGKRMSVNVRLLDDVDVGALPVSVIDGRNLW